MLELINNIVDAVYERAHIVVTGLKQAPTKVPILALKVLLRKEVGFQILHD